MLGNIYAVVIQLSTFAKQQLLQISNKPFDLGDFSHNEAVNHGSIVWLTPANHELLIKENINNSRILMWLRTQLKLQEN